MTTKQQRILTPGEFKILEEWFETAVPDNNSVSQIVADLEAQLKEALAERDERKFLVVKQAGEIMSLQQQIAEQREEIKKLREYKLANEINNSWRAESESTIQQQQQEISDLKFKLEHNLNAITGGLWLVECNTLQSENDKLTSGLILAREIAEDMGNCLERDYAFAEPDEKWKDYNNLVECGRKQRRIIEDTLVSVHGEPEIDNG